MQSVAFQGENGAFSELAAVEYFHGRIRPSAQQSFEGVFKAVENGACAYGVVPIENSLAGSIHQNYDLLLKHAVWICGEIKLRIRHCLIANPGTRLKDVRQIYSHPAALAQCQAFLKKLKKADQFSYRDTAASVAYIKENRLTDGAAVASLQAAVDYKMNVLRSRIEDNEKNFTRFVIITRRPRTPAGRCKTSVVFALKNVPGALYKSLSVFAIRDIDLHKIESRPIPGSPWEYLFYLDFAGKTLDKVVTKAIDHLGELTSYLKVLGSYPVGREASP